jgi:hypothetical protein
MLRYRFDAVFLDGVVLAKAWDLQPGQAATRVKRDRTFLAAFDCWPVLAVLLIACLRAGIVAAADDPDAGNRSTPPPNKLTLAYYDFSSGKGGIDVNLRHTFESSTGWIGGYHQSDGFDQARMGYEYDYHGHWLTVVPSVQAATRGFLGVTLYGEAGRPFFGIVGLGRTNLHPYWNLGFDPNDYIQFGAGYRDRAGNTMSVYAIRDNRLDTGQTNTHVFFRRYLRDEWRLTIDAVSEHGEGDDGLVVRGWAVSVDVDWRRWFIRVAEDPHVNYTPDRQLRVATGMRF